MFDLPGFGASPARTEGLSIKACANVCSTLIDGVSKDRRIVLVGHSVGSIIMTETVGTLHIAPSLVVSLEGNLSATDAYFSGQAANYKEPHQFYQHFLKTVFNLTAEGIVPKSYFAGLRFADPLALWTLGKSIQNHPQPGVDFLKLKCPKIYYWNEETLSPES
nr:alpha/beta hydrolase [Marinicella sp. NBU2979]